MEGVANSRRHLPVSAYEDGSSHDYCRAPLDFLSLSNGVAKFEHAQFAGSLHESRYALAVLDHLFPLLGAVSHLATDDDVSLLLADKSDRAAGEPWRPRGADSKGKAIKDFGMAGLSDYYERFDSVLSCTLKDELRPVGKDARLFRPQDVSSYIEGARLFHHQNLYITRTGKSPVFCRFEIPGQDVCMMFESLRELKGNNFAADGAQWDAHFPLYVAAILCEFRIRAGLPQERVRRYYQMMYNGLTQVNAELLNLVGQPSGHFNTSVDNSLGHIVLMAIHACRSGMDVERFLKEVRFYCCGDDLIWSTLSNCFSPLELQRTYNSLGVYLEFQSWESLPVDDLVFVGVKPCIKKYRGRSFKLFSLVSPRSFASLFIDKRRVVKEPLLKLAKFASLAILWFCDDERFDLAVNMFHLEMASLVRKGRLTVDNAVCQGLARAINPTRLLHQYMGWEYSDAVVTKLYFEPSEHCTGGLSSSCRRLCEMSLQLEIPLSVKLRQVRIGV